MHNFYILKKIILEWFLLWLTRKLFDCARSLKGKEAKTTTYNSILAWLITE